jgi:predicted short-subunit dehydrogenase-like oxidoreductase (DUF2520 family)
MGAVMNRSSAESAVAFIGAGSVCTDWAQLEPAEVWLIGVPDDHIASVSGRLLGTGRVRETDVVVHLSGALAAQVMHVDGQGNARLASLHPLKSIPDADRAWQSFAGTWCGIEGDPAAIEVLDSAVRAIGGKPFRLSADAKMLYHAANAMLSNLLIALLASGVDCHERAGIQSSDALEMVAPLMRETLENGLSMGPESALTGPLVRGDVSIVRAHLGVLDEQAASIYRALARKALALAEQRGQLEPAVLEQLGQLLAERTL